MMLFVLHYTSQVFCKTVDGPCTITPYAINALFVFSDLLLCSGAAISNQNLWIVVDLFKISVNSPT